MKFCKLLVKITAVIFSIIIIAYFALWIYINSFRDTEAIKNYKEKMTITLTEEQAQAAWFTFANNKKYKFTWYPIIFDGFLTQANDNIDFLAGEMIVGYVRKYTSMERHFVSYAMKRYVNRKINWKESLEIILSNGYYGQEQFGLERASQYFKEKNYEELTEKEIIEMVYKIERPHVEMGSKEVEEKVNKIYDRYKN
jgi:membrane carboxypeptidase/penicillin-binding protein